MHSHMVPAPPVGWFLVANPATSARIVEAGQHLSYLHVEVRMSTGKLFLCDPYTFLGCLVDRYVEGEDGVPPYRHKVPIPISTTIIITIPIPIPTTIIITITITLPFPNTTIITTITTTSWTGG